MPLFKLGGGGVTSVGLTAPSSILSVTGSPVTSAGVLALALVTQAANLVWAGPATGPAADPTFRALVAADIPDLSGVYQPLNAKLTAISALANAAGVLTNNGSGVFSYTTPATGTVTSVAMTVPSFLSVAGSPITTTGTLAVTLATQSANLVFAGPGSGLAATPTFRALVATDIPDLSGVYQPLNAKLTAISALANAAGVLTNNGSGVFSYTTPATGTVTSVAMTVPSFLSVAGSPITTAGTFAVTLATETANTVFAGPTSGGAATPTFRALVAADFASIPATTFTMATARILGRTTAGTGAVEELTAGTSLSLGSGSLNTIQDIRTSATPTFVGVNGSSSLLLKTGGTTAVTIDSSQHVGIGAIPDVLFLLDVFGSTTGTNVRFSNSVSNAIELQLGTIPLIVAQNRATASFLSVGYQAIDHTWYASSTQRMNLSSAGVLAVTANSSATPSPLSGTVLQVVGADTANNRIFVDAFAGIPVLNLRRANGTNASKTAVALDDQIGSIGALGYGASAYASGSRAAIVMAAAETWTNTAQGTYMAFYTTATGGTTSAEKARLDQAGNFSVGANPASAYKLAVQTATNINLGVYASSGTTATIAAVNDANSAFVPFKIEALSQVFSTNGSAVMTINSSGNVGIGAAPSTSANEPLQLSRSGSYTGLDLINTAVGGRSWLLLSNVSVGGLPVGGFSIWDGTAGASRLHITNGGTVVVPGLTVALGGIEIPNNLPIYWDDPLAVARRVGLWSGGNIYWGDIDNTQTAHLYFMAGGSGSINYLTNGVAKMIISNAGALRLTTYGAGTLTTDASGNVTAVSDPSLKDEIVPFSRGLRDLMKVDPISFRWSRESGFDRDRAYSGFNARNILAAIPEAVGVTPSGLLSLQDRPILAALVNAVKELAALIDNPRGGPV